jgi:hypothetical protein
MQINLWDTKLPEYACKLHHSVLLQEFVVRYAGICQWEAGSSYGYQDLEHSKNVYDPKIHSMIKKTLASLNIKLRKAFLDIYERKKNYPELLDLIDWFPADPKQEDRPSYFQDIQRRLPPRGYSFKVSMVLQTIETILKRNLILDRPSIFKEYQQELYYLCGEFDDKDLPWDTTKQDW